MGAQVGRRLKINLSDEPSWTEICVPQGIPSIEGNYQVVQMVSDENWTLGRIKDPPS